MGFSAALLALSAVSAISQVGQGYAEKAEANLNATLIEGKAGLIDVQKDIEAEQFIRAKGKAMGESMAHIAGAGVMPTGSKLAIMMDVQKNLEMDQAIGQFNFDQEKRYVMAEADAVRRGGKAAVRQGYSRAFSTMLKAGTQYAMTRGGGNITQQGTIKDTTFDSVTTTYRGNTKYISRTVK